MAPSLLAVCPFCSQAYLQDELYWLQLHIEEKHTEGSHFTVRDDTSSTLSPDALAANDVEFVACPEPECGESVPVEAYNDHLDLHDASNFNYDNPASASSSSASHSHSKHHDMHSDPSFLNDNISMSTLERERGHKRRRSSSGQKSVLHRSILDFPSSPPSKRSANTRPKGTKSVRLGRKELGPYAYEERMPTWLEKKLLEGPKISVVNKIGGDGRLIKQEVVENETPGILQVLGQLSQIDRTVRQAYYAHPSTIHICHTPKEGGFCGYRNLQMLISYIQGARAQGHDHFPGRTPTIPTLQNIIENAWDQGINEVGRLQTGGIKRTRKWIGTPEAQAVLIGLQIDSAIQVFSDHTTRGSAAEQLLLSVEAYFQKFVQDPDRKVHRTLAPPIYLQHPGHSLTIVGFERRKDGQGNLIVFDPMFTTSPAMHKILGRQNIATHRPEVMDIYRRDMRKLRKHKDFELLLLAHPPPAFPAWAIMAQFPAHRFVYVFLRLASANNEGGPGYDVYPEHHFLPAFPWHTFGGLFITDEGRFARTPPALSLYNQLLMRCQFRGTPSPLPAFADQLSALAPAIKPEESGLIPVRMLTEAEMQDALFWQGCGILYCTFGCGKERMGEAEAARKLFRPEEVVS